MAQRIVYWFRNDLRLQDNEGLLSAANSGKEVLPVYVFDPRLYSQTKLGFRRTGVLRAHLLIQAVTELRNQLREKGCDLLIRVGDPEKIVAQLAEEHQANYVYTSKEIAPEETRIESSLSKNLKLSNIDIKLFWMNTLSPILDLPFTIAKLPHGSKSFIDLVKPALVIRNVFETPANILMPSEFEAGVIPSLPQLGIDPMDIPQSSEASKGGNTGLSTLNNFIQNKPEQYVKSQDLFMDAQLSHALALGTLSPIMILDAISKSSVSQPVKDLVLHSLLERDYFHWTLLRYGPRLFKPSGVLHLFDQQWKNDASEFKNWIEGNTASQEVNEIMKKVQHAECISYANRTKAASYLINDLKINWTWGAMYFESLLIDYNVAVNWGQWNNLAGVGLN